MRQLVAHSGATTIASSTGVRSPAIRTRSPTVTRWPRSRAHLQQWLGWLVEEGEVDRSPMDKMRAPSVLGQPVDVLRVEQARAVLDTCESKAFAAGVPGPARTSSATPFAYLMRADSTHDDSFMRLAGLRSRDMSARYGTSALDERARAAHRRLGPGDRL